MTECHARHWRPLLEAAAKRRTRDRFEVVLADEAGALFRERFLPQIPPPILFRGDSMTMKAAGPLDEMESRSGGEIVRTFEPGVPCWWICSSPGSTRRRKPANLDMMGNRAGGIAFGPRHGALFVGGGKIVPDLPAATTRIRECAAPRDAIRHGFDTPCAHAGRRADCNSPRRVGNAWSNMEKSFPPGPIRIVLINADLGL
ncbi:MAG: LUD domain-containing protein [Desulfococcaceae bacterium]